MIGNCPCTASRNAEQIAVAQRFLKESQSFAKNEDIAEQLMLHLKKKIAIPYFHISLKYSSLLLFGGGVYLTANNHPVWGIVLILLGAIVITTNYVTEIDLEAKKYMDYLSLLGLRLNEESKKFETIDRIVITRGSYAQTVNTRAQSRQMDWSDYTGTLLFDNNNSLDLLTKTDKEELLNGLKAFADFLQIGIEDRTTSRHYWIDVSKI